MIPGFRYFLRFQSRSVPIRARAFWDEVSGLRFDEDERRLLERIEAVRAELESDTRTFERTDFGVGSSRAPATADVSVALGRLAKKASVSPTWGQLLFKIARTANANRILELGTCTGLSTAYLQTALDLNKGACLVTIEGDPFLCQIARETLATMSPHPGEVIEGRFQDALPPVLAQHGPFDLVYIDGHHDPVAVQTYFDTIAPHLANTAVVILDDIQPLAGAVRSTWKTIVDSGSPGWGIDLIRMGVIQHSLTQ